MAKRSRKPIKWLTGFILSALLLLSLAIFLSPYGRKSGHSYRLVSHSLEIDATPKTVFNYLGESAHASEWSVYVHHITPLNADSISDGLVGSRRRCFRRADEAGTRWDELITEVVPYQKRQLTLNHLIGFPMSADNLATEQIYMPLSTERCQLTFTVFFFQESSLIDELKMYLAAYVIKNLLVL